MNEIFIKALANRIKMGQIILEQIPEVLRESVQALLDADAEVNT